MFSNFYLYQNFIKLTMNEISEKLKRLRNEDLIWIIYFFVAAFALISNMYDRKYLLNKDKSAYGKEKIINISIFVVAFFIYLYFVLLLTEDLGKMEKNFQDKKYRSTFIQLIAAILFLIGGAIYLVNEVTTNDPDDVGII